MELRPVGGIDLDPARRWRDTDALADTDISSREPSSDSFSSFSGI